MTIARSLVFAAIIITSSLAVKLLASFGVIGVTEIAQRTMMVTIAAFLVYTGNMLPKTLTPLAELRCNPARTQAFQRFAGWTWVITGVLYGAAWMVLPLGAAKMVTMPIVLTGMLAVFGRIVWIKRAA